jgi:hypothetical protein
MDPMLLIGGGIAALLLSKKKADPVTVAQVQQATNERIEQAAPEAIGTCIKLVKPPSKAPLYPDWRDEWASEQRAINLKYAPNSPEERNAYLAFGQKYNPKWQEFHSMVAAIRYEEDNQYNAILESYRQKGWKITTVNIGGLRSSGLAGLDDLGTIIGITAGKVLQTFPDADAYAKTGYTPVPAQITYACPPGTIPIEYQGAIERAVQKNECIVLSSNNPASISMEYGRTYTAVPQDVKDGLKAKGWVQKTISWKVACPEQKPGTSIDAFLALMGNCSDFSIDYLCPPGKEPPPPPSAAAPVLQAVPAPIKIGS